LAILQRDFFQMIAQHTLIWVKKRICGAAFGAAIAPGVTSQAGFQGENCWFSSPNAHRNHENVM